MERGRTLLSQAVAYRTYTRVAPDGRVERWEDVARRVADFSASLAPVEPGEREALYSLILEKAAFPAGRTLWVGGTPMGWRGETSYNCAYHRIRGPEDLRDLQLLLMSGAGVGNSIRDGDVEAFNETVPVTGILRKTLTLREGWVGYSSPEYREGTEVYLEDGEATIIVGDSREGWAQALQHFLVAISDNTPARQVVVDLRSVRPYGERLKTFGGFASGPGPLKELFSTIFKKLQEEALKNGGRGRWTPTLLLDLVNLVGQATVAGGTRRSAESVLFTPGSPITTAKIGPWWDHSPWRAQSNNSAVFDERPSLETVREYVHYAMEYGEPGFVNGEAARKRRPDWDGLNPCLAGDTLIPVPGQGLVFIAELEGKQVPVIDGNGQVVYAKAEKTGENQPLLLVKLSDGSEYKVTPWHEFVLADGSKCQAQHLKPGDELMPPKGVEGAFGPIHNPDRAYVDAWLIADGTWHNRARWAKLYLYPPKHKYKEALEKASGRQFTGPDVQNRYVMVFTGERHALPKDRVPDYVLRGDKETVLAFLRGYLEADGYVRKSKTKGWIVQVVSVHKSFLQQLQALLALFGVHSNIAKLHDGGKRPMPDGNGGYKEYNTRTTYRLVVSNPTKLVVLLGWDTPVRGGYHVQKKVHVIAVEDTGERADVYCFGVPTTQSFDLPTCHSGNCFEILLRDHGVCNLATLVLPAFVGRPMGEIERAARLLARHAVRITFLPFSPLLRHWQKVQEEDRLIGISMTGWVDYWAAQGKLHDTAAQVAFLKRLRAVIHQAAEEYAGELGIPVPLLKTTIKPEGTLSLVAGGVSPGIHDPYAPYYIRRVRMSRNDYVAQALYYLGMEPKPELGYSSLEDSPVWVYEFPLRSPSGRAAISVPAVEQLERYRMMMRHYVDHNASITVYVGKDEVEDVVEWIHKNWDDVVAVSLLPKDGGGYTLAPLEAIDGARYREMEAALPDPSSLHFYVQAAVDAGAKEASPEDDPSCASGACPVR